MAEYSKAEILRSLYDEGALPQDKMDILKSLEDEGQLNQGLEALSNNQQFVSSLTQPQPAAEQGSSHPMALPYATREGGMPKQFSALEQLITGQKASPPKTPLVERKPQQAPPEQIPEAALPGGGGLPTLYPEQQYGPITGQDIKPYAQYVRPVLETAGATTGAIVGGGAGLLTGPGAPAATPTGAALGGGLGYAMASELADLFENFMGLREPQPISVEFEEAAKNVALGTTMEMGGQAIVPGLAATGKALKNIPGVQATGEFLKEAIPPLKAKVVRQRAGEVLAAMTDNGPIIAQNMDEARALEQTIPGLKFQRGQLTGDPNIIKFERALEREPGSFAKDQLERKAANTQAVKDFIESQKGPGTLEDTKKILQAQRDLAEKGVMQSRGALEAATTELGKGQGVREAGTTIKAELKAGKEAAKKEGKKLYQSIPDFEINAKSLVDKINDISKPMTEYEDISKNVPNDLFNRFKEKLIKAEGKTTPRDLEGFQSELKAKLREIESPGGEINERKASRLKSAINAINNVLDNVGESVDVASQKTLKGKEFMVKQLKARLENAKTPEAANQLQDLIAKAEQNIIETKRTAAPAGEQYREARKFWKTEVIDKFKKGEAGEILKSNWKGDRVDDAQVVSRYFKPKDIGISAAKQFKNAVGNNPKAMAAIEDAIKQDMLANAVNPVTKEITEAGLKRWLAKYGPALKEYGLENKFNTIVKARQQLDDALTFKVDFNKSEASKLLDSDVGTEIKNALNAGSKGKAMIELMKKMKGDKRGIEGIQNALIEEIQQIPTTKIATIENTYKKYKQAFNVAFHNNPEKLKAMRNYIDALKKLDIGSKSPVGFDSPTAEHLLTSFFKNAAMGGGRLTNTVKAFMAPLKAIGKDEATRLFTKASLDPDFAHQLIMQSRKPDPTAIRTLYAQAFERIGLPETAAKLREEETRK